MDYSLKCTQDANSRLGNAIQSVTRKESSNNTAKRNLQRCAVVVVVSTFEKYSCGFKKIIAQLLNAEYDIMQVDRTCF